MSELSESNGNKYANNNTNDSAIAEIQNSYLEEDKATTEIEIGEEKSTNKEPSLIENNVPLPPSYTPTAPQNRQNYQNYNYPPGANDGYYSPQQQNYGYGQPAVMNYGGGGGGGSPYDRRQPPASYYGNPYDEEQHYIEDRIFNSSFNTIKIRNNFIKKVYATLSLQLLFTFGFITLAMFEKNVRRGLLLHHLPLSITFMIIFLITYLVLVCAESLRRQFPINYILLAILTLAMTGVMSTFAVWFDTKAFLYAMGTTMLICVTISLFAIQTKCDVTGCGMCLCIGSLVIAIFGMIVMILALCGIYEKWTHIVFSGLATLLFCFYLMYDTQLIIGGKKHELSPEEYIHGSICLYIDVMYIFMHILVLFGFCTGDQ